MLTISSIPAFNDNYIWLLKSEDNHCVVVDPGDAAPVLKRLEQEQLTLDAILVTHQHNDHIGGIPTLRDKFPTIEVIGPSLESIPWITRPVGNDERISVLGQTFTVLDVTGHTTGHIAYFGGDMLFCGDTLFSAGCGRLFEGTPAQMHSSLGLLASLPDDTRVFCAHEYTASNLEFAAAVEPKNNTILEYKEKVDLLRKQGKSTLPSTIGQEKQINPFLRCDHSAVIQAVKHLANDESAVETFTALRRWKDEF